MTKVMEPNDAIRRMHAATTSMERTLNATARSLNKLRADHARAVGELEKRYREGYEDGYRKACADVKRKLGERDG